MENKTCKFCDKPVVDPPPPYADIHYAAKELSQMCADHALEGLQRLYALINKKLL